MEIKVSGRIFKFPPICTCCCAPATGSISESAVKQKGRKYQEKAFQFPYCQACYTHVQAAEAWFGSAPLLSSSCACPTLAADFVEWDGTVYTFDFKSTSYARAFVELNREKVLNPPWQIPPASAAVYENMVAPQHVYPVKTNPGLAGWLLAIVVGIAAFCGVLVAVTPKNSPTTKDPPRPAYVPPAQPVEPTHSTQPTLRPTPRRPTHSPRQQHNADAARLAIPALPAPSATVQSPPSPPIPPTNALDPQ